jgi:Domain of unknown function (DUF6249)
MSAQETLRFTHLIIPVLALLIPIVAIVAHFLAKAQKERQRHQTIRELARAGQPIPPELLADSSDPPVSAERAQLNRILLPGMVNLGLGLGLVGLFAAMSPGSWLWAIGLVPLFLGLALVLLWWAVRKLKAGP